MSFPCPSTTAHHPPHPPQLLRVDHPAAKYTKVLGGAVETEADPSKLKFFDRHKGGVGWGANEG